MVAPRAYDLMVLIDSAAPEDRRDAIIHEIKNHISSGGELKGDADWGQRKLAYEIDHRPEAHYHLFQLEAPIDVLNELDRNLRINDAVLRHRIIRLPKGVPDETPRPPAGRYESSDRDGEQRSEPERPREEAPPAPAQEAAPVEEAAPPASPEAEQQPA